MKHENITRDIIGAAIEVHSTLGNACLPYAGLSFGRHRLVACAIAGYSDGAPKARQEVIYQRALEIEIASRGLSFSREHEMDIIYKGEIIGNRRVDFFVEGCVMVELKALTALEDVHLAQAKNYLEAYQIEIGLLPNFGARSLQFKRIYLNTPSSKSSNRINQGSDKGVHGY